MKIIVNKGKDDEQIIETDNSAEAALRAFGHDPETVDYKIHRSEIERLEQRISQLESS